MLLQLNRLELRGSEFAHDVNDISLKDATV